VVFKAQTQGGVRLMLKRVKIQSKTGKTPLKSNNLRYLNLLSVIDAKLLAILLESVEGGGNRIGLSMEILG
jgi:hypothetical protein